MDCIVVTALAVVTMDTVRAEELLTYAWSQERPVRTVGERKLQKKM